MDDQACPRCKTTKYRNPSLKLMVNVCGHALCESCVDLLFLKGKVKIRCKSVDSNRHSSSLRSKVCKPTAGLMFTYLQREVNNYPANLGVMCG